MILPSVASKPRLPVPRCLLVPAPADRNAHHLLVCGKGLRAASQSCSTRAITPARPGSMLLWAVSRSNGRCWTRTGAHIAATSTQAPIAPCFSPWPCSSCFGPASLLGDPLVTSKFLRRACCSYYLLKSTASRCSCYLSSPLTRTLSFLLYLLLLHSSNNTLSLASFSSCTSPPHTTCHGGGKG